MALPPKTVLARARSCLRLEQAALASTARRLGPEFVATAAAVETALAAGRKLIFTGVGKNAAIASKIAATFNSTGASSCFLDATQALHGDLGLVGEGDLAFLLSNSGQSEEVLRLVPLLKRFGVRVVAFTSDAELGSRAQCRPQALLSRPPRGLPAQARAHRQHHRGPRPRRRPGHGPARSPRPHPRRLRPLSPGRQPRPRAAAPGARHHAHRPALPDRCPKPSTTQDAILAMTRARSGSIALVRSPGGRLAGILTDGDFRRSALSGPDFLRQPVSRFMTRRPKVIAEEALGVEALRLFELHKIDDLIVVNRRGQPVGLVDSQDLPKLKIV
jgi:arabinose-5-phosphate isomerase